MARKSALLAILAVLCGPASAQQVLRVAASEQARQAIESTYVHVVADQRGISAPPPQSSAAQSSAGSAGSRITGLAALPGVGLLGALLIGVIAHEVETSEAARRKVAEVPVATPQGPLDGYGFPAKLQESLDRRLAGSWLKPAQVALGQEFAFPEQVTSYSAESAVLSLRMRYSLSADFLQVRVWCVADLYANSASLRAIAAKERPDERVAFLYRNELMHIGTFDGPRLPPVEAAARWRENGGARLRAALDEAAADIADLLVADLNAGGSAPATGKQVPLEENTIVTLLSESPGRALVRNANGALWSVPSSLIGPPLAH